MGPEYRPTRNQVNQRIFMSRKSLTSAAALIFSMFCLPLVMMAQTFQLTSAQNSNVSRTIGAQPVILSSTVFTSSKGFSLHYPSGWMVASKDQSQQAMQIVQPYLDKLGQVDMDHLAVMVFDPNSGDVMANLNVVVSPDTLDITDEHKDDLHSLVLKEGQVFGAEPSNIRISIESFADKKTMVARYDIVMNGNQLSQMLVIVPGRNQSYLVTCTSAQSDAIRYEPTFKAMIDSMTVDQGFSGIPKGVRFAVIGALIGAAWGLIPLIKKLSQPTPPQNPQSL